MQKVRIEVCRINMIYVQRPIKGLQIVNFVKLRRVLNACNHVLNYYVRCRLE